MLGLGLALFTSSALAAGAEVIEEVTLTDEGPDKPLPLTSAFYLKGVAKPGVREVHPIFVRNTYTALGFGNFVPRLGCNRVAEALRTVQAGGAVLGNRLGVVSIKKLWVRPTRGWPRSDYDSLDKLHEAFAPMPWYREASASPENPGEFKVLISEPAFFRPGATYCLLMFERHRDMQTDRESVRDALLTYGRETSKPCPGTVEPETECSGKEERARQELLDTLDALTHGLPEQSKKRIDSVALDAAGKMPVLFSAPLSLTNLLQGWLSEKVLRPWEPPLLAPVKTDPIARVIGWLLVRRGELFRAGDSFSLNGKMQVNFIGLLADRQGIRLAEKEDASGKDGWHSLQVEPGTLKLPNSEMTLLDVIEFASGRIAYRGRYVPLASLKEGPLKAVLTVEEKGPTQSAEVLREVLARSEALQALTNLAWSTVVRFQGDDARARSPEEEVYYWLGRWLAGQIVTSCQEMAEAKVFQNVQVKPGQAFVPRCDTENQLTENGTWTAKKNAWPGFSSTNDTPLGALNELLRSYASALERWHALREDVTRTVVTETVRRPVTNAPRLGASLNQQAWFDHYVTSYLGYARIHSAVKGFWMETAGVQIYLWPNPVDEPMWANGQRDLRRLFAVELGAGLSTGRFGPLDRFTGFASTGSPPLFVGVAAQFLPYTTFSTGVTLLHARHTSLEKESPQFKPQRYTGASVQFNVVGIIRKLTHSDKLATTQGGM